MGAVDIVLRQGVGKIDSETRIRNRDQARKDDWLGGENEFDWPGDPSRPYDGQAQAGSAPANGGDLGYGAPSGTRATTERAPVEDRDAIVRRRRLIALSILAAVVVLGVVIALATSGGGNKNSSPSAVTTVQQPQSSTNPSGAVSPPPAASSPPASPPPPPAAQSQPQPPPSTTTSSTERVTLANGIAMSSGDSGANVLALQRALFTLGYDVGARDSNFGDTTEAAVMAFQKDQGIKEDGIVGPGTVAKLNAALAAQG